MEIILVEHDERPGNIIQSIHRLKEKHAHIPPISIEHAEKPGICAARNQGAQRATGGIQVHLDADCTFSDEDDDTRRNAIFDMVQPILDDSAVMTYCNTKYDLREARDEKEEKIIKYHNGIAKMNPFPGIPFAIQSPIFTECSGIKESKIPGFDNKGIVKLCTSVLWSYPGGIKKIDELTCIFSPRHLGKNYRKNITK